MKPQNELMQIFAELDNVEDVEQFCKEILSTKELGDLSLRWELLKELHQGIPQRTIAANHGISLCKITRGSKILKDKGSITLKLLDKKSPERETR
jgi:TrpR family trp operon transcriptional repressor